jgi:hypothetical protein
MENETTQNPPPETRPHPGGETRPHPQPEGEYRSMTQTVATAFAVGVASGAGFETGKEVTKETIAKVKDVITSKDDGSKVVLPPGVDPEN